MPKPNKNSTIMIKGDKVESYTRMKNMIDNHPDITEKMIYFKWRGKYPVVHNGWTIHRVRTNEPFPSNQLNA